MYRGTTFCWLASCLSNPNLAALFPTNTFLSVQANNNSNSNGHDNNNSLK